MVASALAVISDLYGLQEGHAHPELSQAQAVLAAIVPRTRDSEVADHPAFIRAASGALISALDLMDGIVRQSLLSVPRVDVDLAQFLYLRHAGRVLDNVRRARNLLVHPEPAPLLQPAGPHAYIAAASRARELEQTCLRALQRTFEQRVGRRLPRLRAETLRLVLDDFTAADLSDADFQGVDMTGMRWSEQGTRWPATVDTDEVRKASEEDPAGSGTYVIRFGTSASFPVLACTGQ
jgi:hypothetical protein